MRSNSLTRGPDTTGPHVPLDNRESSPHPETTAPKGAFGSRVFKKVMPRPSFSRDLEAPESPSTELPTARSPAATPLAGNEPNPFARAAGARRVAKAQSRGLGCVVRPCRNGGAWANGLLVSCRFGQQVAETRPWLAKACEPFACDLPYGRDDAAMKIEASDLLSNRAKRTASKSPPPW